MSSPSPGTLPRSVFAAYLGRNQGPELFTQVNFVANQPTVIPKPLSLSRPLEALLIRWKGRVVIAGANYTAVAAEAPQTIINRIQVRGTWKGTQLTPIDLSGATAFAWPRLFNLRGSSLYIGSAPPTRQPELTVPLAQLGATFGNTGTYDLDIWYFIPVWPIVAEAARASSIVPYLWQPKDWNDTLQVQLNFGDLTSFGTPAGMTTTTFSSFGSGAGSPVVEIYTRYQVLGPIRGGYRSAVVTRAEQSQVGGALASTGNLVRLFTLQKQKTTNVVLKSGINLTGTTAGVAVFSSMSDTIFDVTQIMVDNKPIRNNFANLAAKEHAGLQFGTIEPQGYLPFTFVDSQTPRSALRADLNAVVGSGAMFELDSNIISANANNEANLVQEIIIADPGDPYWADTR